MLNGFTTGTAPLFRGWNQCEVCSFLMHYLFWAGVGVGGLVITGLREKRSPRRKVGAALNVYAEESEAAPDPASRQTSFRSVVKGDCDHQDLRQEVKAVSRIRTEPECAVAEGDASFASDEAAASGGRVKGKFLALLKRKGDGWSVFSHPFLPLG